MNLSILFSNNQTMCSDQTFLILFIYLFVPSDVAEYLKHITSRGLININQFSLAP